MNTIHVGSVIEKKDVVCNFSDKECRVDCRNVRGKHIQAFIAVWSGGRTNPKAKLILNCAVHFQNTVARQPAALTGERNKNITAGYLASTKVIQPTRSSARRVIGCNCERRACLSSRGRLRSTPHGGDVRLAEVAGNVVIAILAPERE